jgi:hypothetical protein
MRARDYFLIAESARQGLEFLLFLAQVEANHYGCSLGLDVAM